MRAARTSAGIDKISPPYLLLKRIVVLDFAWRFLVWLPDVMVRKYDVTLIVLEHELEP